MTTSPFALVLCQAGAEPWLKQELARVRPDLHASYQRPGVVTFKAMGEPFRPDEAPSSVFARVWACAAGPVKSSRALLGAARLEIGRRCGLLDESAWSLLWVVLSKT